MHKQQTLFILHNHACNTETWQPLLCLHSLKHCMDIGQYVYVHVAYIHAYMCMCILMQLWTSISNMHESCRGHTLFTNTVAAITSCMVEDPCTQINYKKLKLNQKQITTIPFPSGPAPFAGKFSLTAKFPFVWAGREATGRTATWRQTKQKEAETL